MLDDQEEPACILRGPHNYYEKLTAKTRWRQALVHKNA